MADKKIRSSNIELLRIVAMLMIILFHVVSHCLSAQLPQSEEYFNKPVLYKSLIIPQIIASFGTVGNDVFILITGYFMANRCDKGSTDLSKVATKLLTQVGFASLTLVIASTIALFLVRGVRIEMIGFQIFNTDFWFVGYYYLIVLCGALFFNRFLCSLDRKQYFTLVLSLFALVSFEWTSRLFDGLAGGLQEVVNGFFLYATGGYIRRYDPFERFRGVLLVFIIAFCVALITLSQFNLAVSNLAIVWERGLDQSPVSHSIIGFSNNAVVSLIMAICMLELFRRIRIPNSKIINFLGSATFMAYLIHENGFMHGFWWKDNWLEILSRSPAEFAMKCAIWTAISFACGVVAYALYLVVMRACKMVAKLFLKPEKTAV